MFPFCEQINVYVNIVVSNICSIKWMFPFSEQINVYVHNMQINKCMIKWMFPFSEQFVFHTSLCYSYLLRDDDVNNNYIIIVHKTKRIIHVWSLRELNLPFCFFFVGDILWKFQDRFVMCAFVQKMTVWKLTFSSFRTIQYNLYISHLRD